MTGDVDETRLDDLTALEALDRSQMLRAVASSAAQIRVARTATADVGLDQIVALGRPRSVVVAGMGGSGISGDVLAAVAGPTCPVPIIVHRGHGLPGWVGANDVVLAVSCSGRTEETLAATDEAIRRGCPLVGVGGPDSPLADRCLAARAPYISAQMQVAPRSSLWALATPLLLVGARLGLLELGPNDADLETAAVRLEQIAQACHPDRESFVNPAKMLALELMGSLPVIWGSGQVGPVAAYRATCQLAENAKLPSISGSLPEAHHNQVVAFDGALAGGSSDDDFFRDRVDTEQQLRIRLVLLDDDADQQPSRADISAAIAEARGVPVSRLRAEGSSAVERLASLVGLVDYATVYLALAQDIDPTPVDAIDELKKRIAAPVV